ncbi:MAG TPA: transcription termination/antitermination protein NusG [Pirellulales bacterium]|nr:transcription termination/antitermination protein NusG [Pirellulales bacterium]
MIDETDQPTDAAQPTTEKAVPKTAKASAAGDQSAPAGDSPTTEPEAMTSSGDNTSSAARTLALDAEREVAEWADESDFASDDAATADLEDDRDNVKPLEESPDDEPAAETEDVKKDWYILKVQSNREDSIADALKRRVKVAGMDEHFDEIIVPVEMITEFKGGKKKVAKRKLYPGYIVVHMAITEETWFLVRETPGIGDFTGSAGRPTAMLPKEVARIVPKDEDVESEEPKLQIPVAIGERVKITEGTFGNFEGEVDSVDTTNGRVTVMINIFGRSTPVELEYWQVEKL